MTLSYALANTLISQVNTSIGGVGKIQFYTGGVSLPTNFPTTAAGLINGLGLQCSTVAIGATSATAATLVTRTFNAITSSTVSSAGNVAQFAICTDYNLNSDLLLWGTVYTNTGDINFNTTAWVVSDNVAITSLTYTQPV